MTLTATTSATAAHPPNASHSGNGARVSPGLRRLVDLMDTRYRLPGTRIRFGLDAVIGLVPGVGDFLGMLIGAAVLLEALRRRVPRWVLAAMVGNLVIDAALGALPLVGDTFDLFFKAHRRNLRLLESHL